MSQRGPKPRMPKNAHQKPPTESSVPELVPPSDLNAGAAQEFLRLCDVLDNRGSLHRVDLAIVAECSRVKCCLDHVYADLGDDSPDLTTLKMISLLTTQRRGLLRELGLTIKPSTTLVKSVAKNEETAEAISGKIKLHA